ncbi:MAG: hypothetical protein MHPDNHAH_02274 [Anaerolineales bacterium]|nr:hypothetical protein [Anaerolineales bacterium]
MKISNLSQLCLLVILVSCSSLQQAKSPSSEPLSDISTSPENYPAGQQYNANSVQNDGFKGLVKIFVKHGVQDINGTVGTYIAQGTGTVLIKNGQWYVITARHIIVPNPNLKEILLDPNDPQKKLEFSDLIKTGTIISLGHTAVSPVRIWLPTDTDLDVAILEVSHDLAQSMVFRPFEVQFEPLQLSTIQLGFDTECWGYPAKQYPQTKKLVISDVNKNFLVLNEALEQGYSGGLVVLPVTDGGKLVLAMILRADQASNQSIALAWSDVEIVFNNAVNGNSSTISIAKNETVNYSNVDFTYYDFYDFPFFSSAPNLKKWWQFWK